MVFENGMLKRYISRFNGLTLEFRHKFSEWQSTGESYDGKDVHAASSAGTFPRKAGDTDFVIIIGCQSKTSLGRGRRIDLLWPPQGVRTS